MVINIVLISPCKNSARNTCWDSIENSVAITITSPGKLRYIFLQHEKSKVPGNRYAWKGQTVRSDKNYTQSQSLCPKLSHNASTPCQILLKHTMLRCTVRHL